MTPILTWLALPGTTLATLSAPLTLGVGEDEIKALAVGGGIVLVVVLAVLKTVRTTTEVREREKTRREIAAYVAEGSITPQDASRLLASGLNEQVAAELARGVSKRTISAAKAREVAEAFHQQQQAWASIPPQPAPTPPPRA